MLELYVIFLFSNTITSRILEIIWYKLNMGLRLAYIKPKKRKEKKHDIYGTSFPSCISCIVLLILFPNSGFRKSWCFIYMQLSRSMLHERNFTWSRKQSNTEDPHKATVSDRWNEHGSHFLRRYAFLSFLCWWMMWSCQTIYIYIYKEDVILIVLQTH